MEKTYADHEQKTAEGQRSRQQRTIMPYIGYTYDCSALSASLILDPPVLLGDGLQRKDID